VSGSETLADWLRQQWAAEEHSENNKWSTGTVEGKACPRCGERIEYTEMMFGSSLRVLQSCGHEMEWDEWRTFAECEPRGNPRKLADIAAKRRILDIHGPAHRCPNHLPSDDEPCRTVLLLAAPFRGVPGWREEWEV
jgi:hypothetical protein